MKLVFSCPFRNASTCIFEDQVDDRGTWLKFCHVDFRVGRLSTFSQRGVCHEDTNSLEQCCLTWSLCV